MIDTARQNSGSYMSVPLNYLDDEGRVYTADTNSLMENLRSAIEKTIEDFTKKHPRPEILSAEDLWLELGLPKNMLDFENVIRIALVKSNKRRMKELQQTCQDTIVALKRHIPLRIDENDADKE